MKNNKHFFIWAIFYFILVFLLFSGVTFYVGKSSVSSELEPLHKFTIFQLEKESRKALTFREGYEGLRDVRIFLEKNNKHNISFTLKDEKGNIVDAHILHSNDKPTYIFQIPIHNLQSDISDLLTGSSEKPTEKIGDLKVMFNYSNPIHSKWYLFSFAIGFAISFSVVGMFAIHQAYFYYKESSEQKDKISDISVSLFETEQAVARAKSIIDRMYHYLENEFKRPADIIRRHTYSEMGSEELSSKALDKLTYNLETVLQARDKWLSSGMDGLTASTSDVYAVGNLSCLSSLSLALELEQIRLVAIKSKKDIVDLKEDCTCIFDLDPMINNSNDIIEFIQLLPNNSYKIGIFSGAIDEMDIYNMNFDLDWVIKEPLVSQITEAVNTKPRISEQVLF